LVLAVTPGLSGQQFQESALEHIKEVKKVKPLMPVAVDGGITPEIAKRCREAGASQAAVGAYLFNSGDPKKAYEEFVVAVGD
jgi:ribulose-phosphate 3-epimerase